jgi:hypothetical protein
MIGHVNLLHRLAVPQGRTTGRWGKLVRWMLAASVRTSSPVAGEPCIDPEVDRHARYDAA